MNKFYKKAISLILCMIMLFGTAPLNGISELSLSNLRLLSGFNLSDYNVPEFSSPFETRASAEDLTSGECGDNLTWSYNEDNNTLTVSGSGTMADYSNAAVVPWSSFRTDIETVVLDSAITTIGSYAFSGCTALVSVNLPVSVTSIGSYAFDGCSSLTNIILPDYLTDISDFAFRNCSALSYLSIPKNVSSIGEGAFRFCSGLHSIEVNGNNSKYKAMDNCLVDKSAQAVILGCNNSQIPTSMITIFKYVTTIGDYAFANCSYIKGVSIPQRITNISETAFYGCSGIESITSSSSSYSVWKNCLIKNNTLVLGCKNSVIPDDGSIRYIGDYSFCGCKLSGDIIIPSGVQSIGKSAFSGCTDIVNLIIPPTVSGIGSEAFSDVLNISYQGPAVGAPWGAKFINAYVELPYVYSDNTRTVLVGSSAFESGTLMVPDGVVAIGDNAFSDCTWINNLYLPYSLHTICDFAFAGCTSLSKVYIPDSVIQIGTDAFLDVNELVYKQMTATGSPWGAKSVTALCGDSLTWSWDSQTKTLHISGTGRMTDYYVVTISAGNSIIEVTGAPWKNYYQDIESIVVDEGIESIGDYAFFGCSSLENISLPESLVSIGNGAFGNCSSIENITVAVANPYYSSAGNCLVEIQSGTLIRGFDDSVIPDNGSVTNIGNDAFSRCGFTSITIPDSVTRIGDFAFRNCANLETVTMTDSITSVGYCAFYNCNALRDVYYSGDGDEWCSIEFTEQIDNQYNPYPDGNARLLDAYIHLNDGTVMSKAVFCYRVENGTVVITGLADNTCEYAAIPNRIEGYPVVRISEGAFRDCYNLNTITIPSNITTIDQLAFENCIGLEKINFFAENCSGSGFNISLNSSDSRQNHWLKGCFNLKTVNIGNHVKTIPSYSFTNFSNTSLGETYRNLFATYANAFPGLFPAYDNSYQYEYVGITDLTIGREVTSIGLLAFAGNINLKTIRYNSINCSLEELQLPYPYNSILSSSTFSKLVYWLSGCNNIDALYIGDDVDYINYSIFEYCKDCKSIIVSPNNSNVVLNTPNWSCEYIEITSPDFHGYIDNCWTYCLLNNSNNMGFYHYSYLCTYKDPETGVVYTDSSKRDAVYCPRDKTGEIVLPLSVEHIRERAFSGCDKLVSVTVPDSVISVGISSFSGVQVVYYTGEDANAPWGASGLNPYKENGLYFYDSDKRLLIGCNETLSGAVNIPETVTEVDGNFEQSGEAITSIVFHSTTLVKFSPDMLEGCNNIQSVYAPYNTENIDGVTVTYTNGIPESTPTQSQKSSGLVMKAKRFVNSLTGSSPDDVSEPDAEIEDNAILFASTGSAGSYTYTVPDSVTSICKNAFANCKNLTVVIPDSVNLSSIGEDAFLNTRNYTENKSQEGEDFTIGKYLILARNFNTDENTGTISYSITADCKGIADGAFRNCPITDVTTSAININFIGKEAFAGCNGLENINLPAVERIGKDVFKNTPVLYSLSSDNPIIKISGCIYAAYKSISSISLSGVSTIAEYAFSGCENLVDVSNADYINRLPDGVFEGCSRLSTIICPSLIDIGRKAFCNSGLTHIDIPASLISWNFDSFQNCDIHEIDISADNENYVTDEFGVVYSKDGKTIIKCPQGLNLKTYTISEDVTRISDFAFQGCNIDYLRIPDKAYDIRNYYDPRNPFEQSKAEYIVYCTEKDNTSQMTLYKDRNHTSVVSVSNSFSGVYDLENTVEEIGMYAFADNPNLTSVNLAGGNLETIKDYAFENCTGLTEVTIPATVTEIGEKAFAGCLNLTKVTFEGVPINLETDAFIHTGLTLTSDSISGINLADANLILHSLSKVTEVEATCTHEGTDCYTCTECDFSMSFAVPKKPHSYGNYIQTGGGTYKKVCSECGQEIYVARSTESQKIKDNRAKLLDWFMQIRNAILTILTFGLIKID